MANGYAHAAFESVPGNELNTPTLSTKIIYEPVRQAAPNLNPSHLERDDELRGIDEPIQVIPEAYQPSWSLDTRLYPDLTGFELKAMLGAPVTTAGNGVIVDPDSIAVPTGATRHVWTAPFGPSGLNPQSTQRQYAYKDQSAFFKLKGCGTDTLALDSPETGGVGLTASGPALYMVRIADPSLTPSYESLTIPPFERSHLTVVTWLGSTAETEDFNLAAANPMAGFPSLAIASKFQDQLEKGDGPIVWTGSIPKRVIGTADFDALVAGTPFTVEVRWKSTANITGSYPYQLWFQATNCQYIAGGPEALANKRRLGGSFNFKCTSSGSAGSTTLTLVNATSSYA